MFAYAIPIKNQLSKSELIRLVQNELDVHTESQDITDSVFKGFYLNTLRKRKEISGWQDFLSFTGIVYFAWVLYLLSHYGFIGMVIITTTN